MLSKAPGWAKVALTVSSYRLRDDARQERGRHVYEKLFQPEADIEQLKLPL
ncbi:DUF6771 family protein [Novosphingobium sp. MBES04]|uniref:DUF6771 family protein n=1 Tax=Novosphingobium sp. MBES04 TaxID=1206458 RepID=UPI00404094E8